MLFVSNVKSAKKIMVTNRKTKSLRPMEFEVTGKRKCKLCSMWNDKAYNTSTFSTTLKFVNSWGVHCFFLHFHLPSFILQKNKKVTSKSQERAV